VNGKAESDVENDVLKIVMLSRYKSNKLAIAFVRNFGLTSGAIASSVSHDSHNIISIGTNDIDIVEAINAIVETKGGLSVSNGGVASVLPLPFAGLMDNRDAHAIAEEYELLDSKAKLMGTTLEAPFMTLSFMGLLVIPELKLSDLGLCDAVNFQFVELFVEP
jgi:adenine deaminase